MKTGGWIPLSTIEGYTKHEDREMWIYRNGSKAWGDCRYFPYKDGYKVKFDTLKDGIKRKEEYYFESMAQADLMCEALMEEDGRLQ